METPLETDGNLAGAVRKILRRLVAVGHNRAELLIVEVQEQSARAQKVFFLGAGIVAFGMLAMLTVTALIACAFAHRLLLALGILTGVYALSALIFYVMLSRLLRRWDAFAGTREQFERDCECLQKEQAT